MTEYPSTLRYKRRQYKRTRRYRHNVVNLRNEIKLHHKVEYKLVKPVTS